MSRYKTYFGTRGFMQWVPECAIDPDFSKKKWTNTSLYLNGGAGVSTSTGSHKEYTMSWNSSTRDSLRPIVDYADGVYDSVPGVNLIYFLDPMTTDKNVLPQLWATPATVFADGMSHLPGQKARVVPTPINNLLYPARSVVYTANTSSTELWIPIPPGYTAWLGAHGSATGAASMQYRTTLGLNNSNPVMLPMLSVTTETRFSTSVEATGLVDGVLVSFANLGVSSLETITLSGFMVQILRNGIAPAPGGFISGQGHSGCQFDDSPTQTPRGATVDRIAMSAKLIETGSWL